MLFINTVIAFVAEHKLKLKKDSKILRQLCINVVKNHRCMKKRKIIVRHQINMIFTTPGK